MRRSFSAVSFGSLAIVIVIFIVTWGASSGASLNNLLPGAGPVTSEDLPGIAVTDVGTIPLPTVPAVGQGTPEPEYTLRLKRVDLWLGAVTTEGHPHDGSFVLTVDSGAVCYTLLEPAVNGTVVTATVPEHVEPASACPAPDVICGPDVACTPAQTDCDGGTGCILEPGETVYLPAGSTVTQMGDGAQHWYGNVDPYHPAVVYLAEYQLEGDDAGCGGSCH